MPRGTYIQREQEGRKDGERDKDGKGRKTEGKKILAYAGCYNVNATS